MNIDITSILLGLLGGLALFLYGMQMMSSGLEAAAGNRMKHILEKLTANRVLGVLVGAGITAVIQSSSATTVMVVGFVNSCLLYTFSEPTRRTPISYAVFCLKKKKKNKIQFACSATCLECCTYPL